MVRPSTTTIETTNAGSSPTGSVCTCNTLRRSRTLDTVPIGRSSGRGVRRSRPEAQAREPVADEDVEEAHAAARRYGFQLASWACVAWSTALVHGRLWIPYEPSRSSVA